MNATATGYYGDNGQPMTAAAYHAIIAARMRRQVGRYAATRYALRRGSSLRLVRLAAQLQAAAEADAAVLDFTSSSNSTGSSN